METQLAESLRSGGSKASVGGFGGFGGGDGGGSGGTLLSGPPSFPVTGKRGEMRKVLAARFGASFKK
jgi:hypothetical protein